jgi:hypothetical protein
MAKRCQTLVEAFQFVDLKRSDDQKRGDQPSLWTILRCPSGAHYVYFSDRNPGQQMHNIASTILQYRDSFQQAMLKIAPEKREEPSLPPDNLHMVRDFVQEMGELLKDAAVQRNQERWGGHAEEAMIQHFPKVLLEENKVRGAEQAAQFVILNSDSPCTTQDKGGSNNLAGWPASCTAKLLKLADDHQDIEFVVFFMRRYGVMDEGADAAKLKAKEKIEPEAQRQIKQVQGSLANLKKEKAAGDVIKEKAAEIPAIRAKLEEDVENLSERYRNKNVSAYFKGLKNNSPAYGGRITIYPFTPELTQEASEFKNL